MFLNFIFFFVFGAICGSFFNMLIYRLPRKKSIVGLKNRSFCPQCKHKLDFSDLIPLISFFILKAKCRYCNKPISWRYFIVEMFSALLFTLIFAKYQNIFSFNFWLVLLLSCVFFLIFFIDLETMIIPDNLLITALIINTISLFIPVESFNLNLKGALWNINWALIWFGLFFLIYFFTKGKGMGFGDVKYAGVLGFIFSQNSLYVILSAFIIGGIWASFLLLTHKKNLKDKIPFAPFLSLSAIIFLLK